MNEFCKIVTFDDDFIFPPVANPITTTKAAMIAVYSTFGVASQVSKIIQKTIIDNFKDFEISVLGPKTNVKLAKSQIAEFFNSEYFNNLSNLKLTYEKTTEEHNLFVVFGLCALSAVLPSNFVYCDLTSSNWLKTLTGAINGT